jgi:DNA polymerase-3 subunit delta'
VADAATLLAAAGDRPENALQWSQAGRTAQHWSAIPRAVSHGTLAVFADWAPAQVVDALQKLCHDLQLQRVGAAPRFFAATDLPAAPPLAVLTRWAKELNATARVVEHPFNPGLLLEALVGKAQNTLNSRA